MGHSHDAIYPQTHAEKSMHEYWSYVWLFVISFVSAAAESLIAIFFAHSVSAQADAIHTITHLSLYALALYVSRQIVVRGMNSDSAHDYREKFLIWYVLMVFMGLVWISYTSIAKLFSSEPVASNYMLLGVSIGLCGNIIVLALLHKISKIHGDAVHKHTAHSWLSLDAWGDSAFSVIVLLASVTAILFPALPIRIIDPVLSLGAVIWIGWSAILILKKTTI